MSAEITAAAAPQIAIIGLGYVGLPLAVEFGKRYPTVGFDIRAARVEELQRGHDSTLEVEPDLLAQATQLRYSATRDDIKPCNVFVVTVPTPIDAAKRPDLTPLIKASEAIGSVLKPGDTVIYESTVYPGCTEEVCVPILERVSGLRFEATANPGEQTFVDWVNRIDHLREVADHQPSKVNFPFPPSRARARL